MRSSKSTVSLSSSRTRTHAFIFFMTEMEPGRACCARAHNLLYSTLCCVDGGVGGAGSVFGVGVWGSSTFFFRFERLF